MSRERALFASAAEAVSAGNDGPSAPRLVPNRAYRLQLLPASQVSFPVAPGRTPAEGSHGGVFALIVPSFGSYRIAVDVPLWIDVAADGKLLPAADYEGQHDCSAPRKIVEFALEGKQTWVLQVSASARASVRLTITAVSKG